MGKAERYECIRELGCGKVVPYAQTDYVIDGISVLSCAIANEYAILLRQLVEDESRVCIDKSTMSYYSDYHVKKNELKSLECRLLQKDIGEIDRQLLRQDMIRVKNEMEKSTSSGKSELGCFTRKWEAQSSSLKIESKESYCYLVAA